MSSLQLTIGRKPQSSTMDMAAIEDFAVIVPAYNASDTILECVRAISNSVTPPSEIIVYNDGRIDNISERELGPVARVITNPGQPVGPARGRNIGAVESTCDILIFVDADV